METNDRPEVGVYVGNAKGAGAIESIEGVLLSILSYLEDYRVTLYGNTTLNDTVASSYAYYETDRTSSVGVVADVTTTYLDTIEYVRARDPAVLLHLNNFVNHGPAIALAGQRTGTPTIIRVSGDVFRVYTKFSGLRRVAAYAAHNIFGRVAVTLADRVIVFGPYQKREVVDRVGSRNQVDILPPALPVQTQFRPPSDQSAVRKRLGLPCDGTLALYVGPIEDYKGMSFLESVIDRSEDIVFLLVGSGSRRKELADAYPESVITAGHVPHTDIHEWYKAANVYVHPSPHEGVPLVILEAISCGTPVVARNAGDIDHYVPNVTEQPTEMAALLTSGEYTNALQHYRNLSPRVQAERLNRIVGDLVRG